MLVDLSNSAADTAYLAGILDGEGCIRISMGVLHVRVNQAQKNRELLSYLHSKWGGCFYSSDKRKTASLTWSGRQAAKVLIAVKPYLTLKLAQAQLALEFQELLPGKHGCRIDPPVRLQMDHLAVKIKDLKDHPWNQ